jgi:hypothetical protein
MWAMPSCEVQRTLVKSPPELWAELSDPASLARHLGEFGEIRTIRVEPETAVEWEAEDVRGAVQLKPSGWGTKVTLTAVREIAESAAPPEPLAPPEPEAVAEPKTVTELEPEPEAATVAEPEPVTEPEPTTASEPERRPRLLARIFRRLRKDRPIPEPEPVTAEDLAPIEAPEQEPAAEEPPDLAAELAAVERSMLEQDATLLTAVLDRLGAAHHRPFSRG